MNRNWTLTCATGCIGLMLATAAAAALSPAEEGRRLWLSENGYGCHGGRAGAGAQPLTRAQAFFFSRHPLRFMPERRRFVGGAHVGVNVARVLGRAATRAWRGQAQVRARRA